MHADPTLITEENGFSASSAKLSGSALNGALTQLTAVD
jgi:hypothetical protein